MRGFEDRSVGPSRLTIREDVTDALIAAGADDPPALVMRLGTIHTYSGRGSPELVEVSGDAPLRVVVRVYRRGGMMRGILPTIFFVGDRARTELEALCAADDAGVAVVRPIAAIRRRLWMGYRAWLITEEVADASDLLDRIRERRRPGGRPFDPRATLEAVGHALRRLHDAGIGVPDLHVKNVLVPDQAPQSPVLLDFDRARVSPEALSRSERLTQISRFDRSLEKAGRNGSPISRIERARFWRGYRGDTPVDAETRRRACKRHQKHLAWHRFVWRLTGR